MKIANKIIKLAEKFNASSSIISKYGMEKVSFNGVSSVYTINQNRNSATKGLILFNGEKARIFEIDLRVYITSTLAHGNFGILKFTGAHVDVNDFVANVEKLWKADVEQYTEYSAARTAHIIKKFGTAKTSKDTNWIDIKDAYAKLLDYGFTKSSFKFIKEFEEINIEDVAVNFEKVDNFSVFGFNKKNEKLKSHIKEAVTLLKKYKLSSLIYGNFFLLKKLNKVVNADYHPQTDEIRIFEQTLADKNEATRTILHELGHRHYYKFLDNSSRREIESMYYKHLRLADTNIEKFKKDLKVGDKLEFDNKPVEYAGIGYLSARGRKPVYKFYYLDKQGNKTDTYRYYKTLADALTSMKADIKGQYYGTFLPSYYSKTNAVEWFAEVFAHGILGENKEAIDWIKMLK